METKIKILAVVLGVQLVAALGLGLSGGSLSTSAESGPLLTIEDDSVDEITLTGPEGERLLFAKTEDGWQLPEEGPFPANRQQVKTLLDRLKGLQVGLPVGSSDEARGRFKVSEEAFERKVVLAKDEEEVATLYLGTSPKVRRIHVRIGDHDPIYAVALAAHDVPVDSEDWLDKRVLQFDKEDITSIEVAGLTIARESTDLEGGEEKTESAWSTNGLGEGESLDQEAADKLADTLSDLRIGEVLGKEEKVGYGMNEPMLEITVKRNSGEPIHYVLGKTAEKEEYTLKASTRPEYFRLPSFRATPLLDASKLETLVQRADQEQKDTEKAQK